MSKPAGPSGPVGVSWSLRQVLRRLYRTVVPLPADQMARRLRRLLDREETIFVVQVGANDGQSGDPLHRLIVAHPGWRGLFVEPVAWLFEQLQENWCHDPRFIYANVAIAGEAGSAPFYYLGPEARDALGEQLPDHFSELGSFDRDHLVRALGPAIEPHIIAHEVPCEPLSSLLERHGIERVDVLQIDTEGYDYEVLKQFDPVRFGTWLVLYEQKHLSPADQAAAKAHLTAAGLTCTDYRRDVMAVGRRR